MTECITSFEDEESNKEYWIFDRNEYIQIDIYDKDISDINPVSCELFPKRLIVMLGEEIKDD